MSHINAMTWWYNLSREEQNYWNHRFILDDKVKEDLDLDKQDYCYQVMLWERSENGSC